MRNKLLLLPLFVLFGCDPTARIHGEHPGETLVERQYKGDFSHRNFVEADLSTYKEIIVVIGRGKDKLYPDGFTDGQDTKEVYYVVRPDALVFFNVKPDDHYFIIIGSEK
jgi:hypothetical protein